MLNRLLISNEQSGLMQKEMNKQRLQNKGLNDINKSNLQNEF